MTWAVAAEEHNMYLALFVCPHFAQCCLVLSEICSLMPYFQVAVAFKLPQRLITAEGMQAQNW